MQKITSLPADDALPGWYHTSQPRTPRPAHVGQKHARWAIVGAGLTGLAAARQLALNFPDDEVVLVEPIYRMPPKRGRLPSRAEIYAGALSENYVLAYSNSLMDNFIMDVQGSGYIDFGDGSPLNFFSYAGKNGHAYRSIGKVLIDRGEVKREDMSMQAIREWGEKHSEAEVRELLEQNPSFVFFKPQNFAPVKGASAVPLIGRASVASDRSIIPAGTTLLAEVPLLDNNGKFNGKYELRLMVALDVGGAIKGQHFDIYQGIGPDAGHRAGWYNHYGRVWVLKAAPGTGNVFSG